MAQWNPLHDLVSLQDRMNRLFRRRDAATSELKPIRAMKLSAPTGVRRPTFTKESEYVVAVDLPGIDRATLDISVDENRLTIRGIASGSRHDAT